MGTSLTDALADYRDQLRPAPAAHRRGPRWRLWLCLGLAAAVLAGGASATVRSGASPTPGANPQPTATSAPTSAGGTSATLSAAVPVADWRAWSSPVIRTWLPTVPGAGPDDPAHLAGFARTPDGALAAAVSLHPAIYYTRDRAAWQALADRRVVWAAGQREQLTQALDRVWQVADLQPVAMTPLGYRPIAYTAERARFRVWWRLDLPDGASPMVGALVDVVWHDGDWSLSFDEPAMDMRGLQPTDSYLSWGPA